MQRLWSPWRSRYIQTFTKTSKRKRTKGSIFTTALKAKNDEREFIIWRGKHCFVIMNRYPYNSGHLLIVPYRQTGRLEDMTAEELAEITATVQRATRALGKVMRPHGYNFGANIGRAAGAGVDDHIHFHLVPRWNGDTNFMPVLADTKIVSEEMRDTLRKLRKVF